MNLILSEIQASQWVLLGVILLLVICYPIFMIFRNKKEQQKVNELSQSIKVGKDVLTSSGVYGTVVDIRDGENGSKIVTLQTGVDDKKSYLSIDALAVYTVLNPDPVQPATPQQKPVAKTEQKSNAKAVENQPAKTVENQPAKTEESSKTEKVEEKSEQPKENQIQEKQPAKTEKKQTTKSDKTKSNKKK